MERIKRYTFPKFSKSEKGWIIDTYIDDVYFNYKKFKTFDLAYEYYKKLTKV